MKIGYRQSTLILLLLVVVGWAGSPTTPLTARVYQGSPAILYDSGIVAGGVAITSTCIDTSKIDMLEVVAVNSDAAVDRYVTLTLYDTVTCTNAIFPSYGTGTAVKATTKLTSIGRGSAPSSSWTDVPGVYLAMKLSPGVKIGLSAGGTSNGRIYVW